MTCTPNCAVCGHTVFVTGGTGSFGRAFVKHILEQHNPERVVVYSRDEQKQADMLRDLTRHRDFLRFRLGDVRDRDRLRMAMPEGAIVVHAAALKIIAFGQVNPDEIIKTNVVGTMNVLQAAHEAGAPKTIFISSDKACEPINVYGHSKAVAEAMVVTWNAYGLPRGHASSCVRYGNVLGSRGSVIELWREQIAKGLPITITDHDMTRFLITLPQAVALVLQALSLMRGGEIFVPILPAASVLDLMVAATGGSQKINYIGAQPGEKMHECLVTASETSRAAWVVQDSLLSIEPTPELSREPWPNAKIVGSYISDFANNVPVERLQEMLNA